MARREPRVELEGPTHEALRKEVVRSKGFPRAFYANSLARGFAQLDGKDEMGVILGDGGHRIRENVKKAWQAAGGVVVVYKGQQRLGVIINP